MLIQDSVYEEIETDELEYGTRFNEPTIESDAQFDRFCCYLSTPAVISKMFESFEARVKRCTVTQETPPPVFLFPDHFNEPVFVDPKNTRTGEWMRTMKFNEQFVFDFRSDREKKLRAQ